MYYKECECGKIFTSSEKYKNHICAFHNNTLLEKEEYLIFYKDHGQEFQIWSKELVTYSKMKKIEEVLKMKYDVVSFLSIYDCPFETTKMLLSLI